MANKIWGALRCLMDMQRLDANSAPATHAIIGAMIEVHRELGSGYLEIIYQDALEYEFEMRNIAAQREAPLPVVYKGKVMGNPYRADFLCGDVLVELKAQGAPLSGVAEAQVIHYLRSTGLQVALLANFGRNTIEVRRFVSGHDDRRSGFSVEDV